MYEPIPIFLAGPKHKRSSRRFLYRRIYRLKTDKHRGVWYRKAVGHVEVRQYPHLYPLTRRVTDFGV